jgi:hypothetical protein
VLNADAYAIWVLQFIEMMLTDAPLLYTRAGNFELILITNFMKLLL